MSVSKGAQLSHDRVKAQWLALCDRVADLMKIYTRPFVPILAGAEIGTGTFNEKDGATDLVLVRRLTSHQRRSRRSIEIARTSVAHRWSVVPRIEAAKTFCRISEVSRGSPAGPTV